MSTTLPTDPAERDALAAEYALGTADARLAAAIAAALPTDAALRAAVEAWEARLAPLTALATPESPPPDLWARIEARIAPLASSPAPPASSPVLRGNIPWWRAWAIGATLAAAGFAALAVLPRAPETRYMTVLVTDRSQPAWLAQADSSGRLSISTVAAMDGSRPTTPEGRVMQLWGLAPGDPGPTSLGLLPREPGRIVIDTPALRPRAGMLIEITLEPPGGSPIGRPTGPILFIGRLSEAGPNT